MKAHKHYVFKEVSSCLDYSVPKDQKKLGRRSFMKGNLGNSACGLGFGNTTRDPQLGKLMLYQLSYSRTYNNYSKTLFRCQGFSLQYLIVLPSLNPNFSKNPAFTSSAYLYGFGLVYIGQSSPWQGIIL